MPKYRITWRLSHQHGEGEEIIEAKDQAEAEVAAYEALLQEVDSECAYNATEITDDEETENATS